MRREQGITVTSLVVTVIIMSILAAISISAAIDDNLLNQKDIIQNDFNELIQDTNNKIKTEREKWERYYLNYNYRRKTNENKCCLEYR